MLCSKVKIINLTLLQYRNAVVGAETALNAALVVTVYAVVLASHVYPCDHITFVDINALNFKECQMTPNLRISSLKNSIVVYMFILFVHNDEYSVYKFRNDWNTI